MRQNLSITITNNLSEIKRVYAQLEEFGELCHLKPDIIFSMNLAFDELLTNVISYGYNDDKEHLIQINVSLKNDELIANIEDDGKAFNPIESPEPDITTSIEERKIGGLGIHIMRHFTDELSYKRENNKNIVSFKKKINK